MTCLETLKTWTDIVLNISTTIALLAGGYWALHKYFRFREYMPGSVLEHSVHHLSLENGVRLLYVDVVIQNVGKTALEVTEFETAVELVDPVEMKERINFEEKSIKEPFSEETWQLYSKALHAPKRIEPGETDMAHCEFTIPPNFDFCRLRSSLKNSKQESMQWEKITLHRLSEA